MTNIAIGLRIKQRREEIGMTQEELAQLVGYTSKSTINKIENGVNDIKQTKIAEFAEALKTTPGYLMGWEDKKPEYYFDDEAKALAQFMYDNPKYKVLFDATRKIKAEDIEIVKTLLDKFGDES